MVQVFKIPLDYKVVEKITAVRKCGTFRETWPKRKKTQNAFELPERQKPKMQLFKTVLKKILMKHSSLKNYHNCIKSLYCVVNSRQRKKKIITTFECLHKAKWVINVDTCKSDPKSILNWLNVELVVTCNGGNINIIFYMFHSFNFQIRNNFLSRICTTKCCTARIKSKHQNKYG